MLAIYKIGHYEMRGLDGNEYGNCIVFPSVGYEFVQDGALYRGIRLFRCLTKHSVRDIPGFD
jgi:hypothetical protein